MPIGFSVHIHFPLSKNWLVFTILNIGVTASRKISKLCKKVTVFYYQLMYFSKEEYRRFLALRQTLTLIAYRFTICFYPYKRNHQITTHICQSSKYLSAPIQYLKNCSTRNHAAYCHHHFCNTYFFLKFFIGTYAPANILIPIENLNKTRKPDSMECQNN